MRATLCLVFALAGLLSSCKRATGTVAQFAENTRTATEQMAYTSEQENAARDKNIAPAIGEARNPQPLKLVERYETREGPDGLFVYDTETHSIARIGSKPQSGLNFEQASKAVGALTAADAKGIAH